MRPHNKTMSEKEIEKENEVEVEREVEEKVEEAVSNKISYEDFKKIEIKIGKILSVEKVEGADKLVRLEVDLAEDVPRQIISGIALYFEDIQELAGKKCTFVTNLEPRTIFGLVSNGMIFAVSDDEGNFSILEPKDVIPSGTTVT